MLVLTRRRGESIVIDGGIEITVLDVSGEKVRIGIEAPPEIEVYRQEVLTKIAAEGRRKAPRSKIEGTEEKS